MINIKQHINRTYQSCMPFQKYWQFIYLLIVKLKLMHPSFLILTFLNVSFFIYINVNKNIIYTENSVLLFY